VLESSKEPRLVHSSQAALQVGSSGLDGICWIESFWLQLKTFPRLFTGCSATDEIWSSPNQKRNWSVIFPFFRTIDQDFVGLKLMCAHVMSLSNPWRIHLAPGTAVVLAVRSSMKALMGGCFTPDLLRGPRHSVSADLTSIFIANVKRDGTPRDYSHF